MNPFKAFEKQIKPFITERVFKELQYFWTQKTRFYHNINHLIQILQDIEKNIWFKELYPFEKRVLLLAAFFHDAIYDPKKKNNEDESIKYFKESFILHNDYYTREKVIGLIEVTKYRKRPFSKLAQIFWDADNAGFKKGYDIIFKNEKLIRKEFSFVPDKEYKENRIKFLKSCIGLFGTLTDKDLNKLIAYIEKTY